VVGVLRGGDFPVLVCVVVLRENDSMKGLYDGHIEEGGGFV
jgi:hypothetical protein